MIEVPLYGVKAPRAGRVLAFATCHQRILSSTRGEAYGGYNQVVLEPFLGHFTEYGDFKRRARSIESTPVRTPKAQSSGMKRRVEDDWVVGDGTVGGGVREMTLLVKVCPRGQRESLWLSAFDQAWQAV